VKNWLALSLVLVFGSSVAWAAEAKKSAKPAVKPAARPAAAKPAAPAAAKAPRIVVEPAVHDFGKAAQSKTLSKEFTLKNVGGEDLVIGDVQTSCGCTVAQLATKTLKPGASTPLTVNLETRLYEGKLERTITIPSNDPEQKNLQVKVTAEVAGPPKPAAQ
jgi:hypothetical protein